MQLVSKISNLCDPDPPTSQTDRRTDRRTDGQTDGRHAISIPRDALVHRAVKTRGRPRRTWTDDVMGEKKYDEVNRLAEDTRNT